MRGLDIGAGNKGAAGLETLDIRPGADHVCDASRALPFLDCTFDLVHASHVLEHIPWWLSESTLREWMRILTHGGRLEIWAPNTRKIFERLIRYEDKGEFDPGADWWPNNPEKDVYLLINARVYYYGDWHRAFFTPRSLLRLLKKIGLHDVRALDPRTETRSREFHGWINMGAMGIKP